MNFAFRAQRRGDVTGGQGEHRTDRDAYQNHQNVGVGDEHRRALAVARAPSVLATTDEAPVPMPPAKAYRVMVMGKA